MRLKALLRDRFIIAAVIHGDSCPAESFITDGEAAYESSRDGLACLLAHVSKNGLLGLSSKQTHEVDKRRKIYEFPKGDLRLFYFKGEGPVAVVCTGGLVKKGQKADKHAVKYAASCRDEYMIAIQNNGLEWVD